MLDSSRLRLLVAVADTGSIAGAAAELGCSPAAASQQLGVLERESGAHLLERSARSVRLSSAGRLLVERARPILADLNAAAEAVAQAGSGTAGRLRIASFASVTRHLVVPAMTTLRRRNPQLELTFTELEPEEALPAVQSGQIDVAITHQYTGFSPPDTRGLRQTHLFTDPLLLAVPATHPAAGAKQVRLADFDDADWISGRTSSGFQAVTETAAHLAGFQPRVTSRADTYAIVLNLVAADLGIALVPRSAVAPRTGFVLLPVTRPANLARTVHVTARSNDRSPAVAALREHLVRKLPSNHAARSRHPR